MPNFSKAIKQIGALNSKIGAIQKVMFRIFNCISWKRTNDINNSKKKTVSKYVFM